MPKNPTPTKPKKLTAKTARCYCEGLKRWCTVEESMKYWKQREKEEKANDQM